jgi:hypothetical protein
VLSLVSVDGEPIERQPGAAARAEGGPTQEIPEHQLAKVRGLLDDSGDEPAADPPEGAAAAGPSGAQLPAAREEPGSRG